MWAGIGLGVAEAWTLYALAQKDKLIALLKAAAANSSLVTHVRSETGVAAAAHMATSLKQVPTCRSMK